MASCTPQARNDAGRNRSHPDRPRRPTRAARGARGWRPGRPLHDLEQIGSGGMGRIFEAHDPNLQRRVALKVLHARGSDTHRQRLLREAQALARLGHPNVITVHEVGEHDGSLFIAMELVTGGTLKDWLEANPPGDEARQAEALRLLVDAGRGILAAHGAGLIHRDVKPSNILLGADGRARVADFGIVRSIGDAAIEGDVTANVDARQELYDSKTGSLTRSGAAVGTPAYMAPEQFDGRDVGEAADQFSFCVTAWEALLGERPFQGASVGEVLGSIRDGRPRPEDTSLIPAALAKSLRKGLNLRPRDRHRTLAQLVDDLDAFATTGRPAPRPLRRGLVVALGGGALAASVAAYQIGTRDGPCPTAKDRFASVWNDARAQDYAARGDAWTRAAADLDAYATAWVAAYDDACQDARIRGEQTEAQMLERQACLEEERDALEEQLRSAEAGAVVEELQTRGAPEVCNAGFGITLDPPDDHVALLAKARDARSEARFEDALRHLDAMRDAGRLPPAVEAHEAYEQGMAVIPIDDHEQGHAILQEAYETANRRGQSDVAIQAALSLSQFAEKSARREWLSAAQSIPGFDKPEHARRVAMAEFLVDTSANNLDTAYAAVARVTSEDFAYRDDPAFLLRAAKVLLRAEIDLERALQLLDEVESLGIQKPGEFYSPVALRC
ncbi:MAG: serine/threonine-protein kinase [Myxococcota bacterium]